MGKDYKEVKKLRHHIDSLFLKKNKEYDFRLVKYQAGLMFEVSDRDIENAVVEACYVYGYLFDKKLAIITKEDKK